MLDPGKRKCHQCYEDRDKWGIPIPNCLDPDGDGKPCQYPEISRSLMSENLYAVDLWQKWATHLIRTEASLSGVIYTLNLGLLREILEEEGQESRMSIIKKVAAIFQEWRTIQNASDSPKTKESMRRLEKTRKSIG